MTALLVECAGLVKIYKVLEAGVEVVALQGLDLEVRAGEMLAIVGRSGSGKSTLLNILGGVDQPSAGQCRIAGHLLSRMNEGERTDYRRFVVGHVWQQSGRNLVPDLTILENVELPQFLARVGARTRRARAQESLRQVGLADHMHKRPDQLSGGEQQRAAIAVALANGPQLLLADEPTGELDSATAGEIVALLRSLTHALDLTVILVTHDAAVAAVADRTVLIRDGRTSAETVRRGPPMEISEAPVPPDRASSGMSGGLASSMLVLVDRRGWLQLPDAMLRGVAFSGRAEINIEADRVELWPVGELNRPAGGSSAGSAGLGAPVEGFRDLVVIDPAGRLQLPEVALRRIPFGRHATIHVAGNHIELRPATTPAGGE